MVLAADGFLSALRRLHTAPILIHRRYAMAPENTLSAFSSVETASPAHAAAHLVAIFESTPEPMWSVDLDFNLVSFNQAFVRYFESRRGIRPEAGMKAGQLVETGREDFWVS